MLEVYGETTRERPIARRTHVLVCGGGPADLAAAIAAARAGAKTLLLEQFGYLGVRPPRR